MNISFKWLKDYINFNGSAEELAAVLTSIGLETGSIEEVETIRGGLKGLVIGKVLTCIEHPDSDHLHITTVDLGQPEPAQIVCGAPNVAAGQTVVVATVGTKLYDGDKEFQIKKSKIRGVESLGMICAEDEIGIGHSHDGIIVINEDVKPGTPAAEYYHLESDMVLEVDLTPNRVDAASHYGVARDTAAWMSCHSIAPELKRPSVEAYHTDRPDGAVSVAVENSEACPRYSGVTIRGVKIAESPEWLKNRLTAIGLRPINNVVDITNYVLHSVGQPLHCFDLAKIKGEQIVVKTCPAGTKFTTLDGVERTLDERDLMICNAQEPMCLAGVFGGLDSGVTDSTTDVFLESAYFNPTWVRKAARRHGLSTDSSFRFERGCDPNATVYALKIAALLIKELAGGEICGEIVDIYPEKINPCEVRLDYDKCDSLIGKHIPHEQIRSIVKSLEMEIKNEDEKGLNLLVPTYRVDVQRPCDVIEDLLRIYGYNNVELSDALHSSLSFKTPTDAADDLRRLVSEQLAGAGFNEILNNSLTAESYYAELTTYPLAQCVRLLNPLSADLSVMRQTMLFGGLESIAYNINRKAFDLAFYEFGNVYFFNPEAQSTAEQPLAPYSESARLALWMTGNQTPASWNRKALEVSFYDLRAVCDNIFSRLGLSNRELAYEQQAGDDIFGAYLSVATRSGKAIGNLGIVSAPLLKKFGIKQPVVYAELNWDVLANLSRGRKTTYSPLPRTMAVKRDLALLIDSNVTMSKLETIIAQSERRLLKEVALFDVYEGDKLPAGKKSYAVSITLQDDEKTLQDKQIDAVMNKIIANLKEKAGAELR